MRPARVGNAFSVDHDEHVAPARHRIDAHVRVAPEFNSFAVCDRLPAKHHAHVARTLAYMNPVARIAVDRYTLLSDIALHNRLLGSGRPVGRPYKRFFVIFYYVGRARSARYENFASFAFLRRSLS